MPRVSRRALAVCLVLGFALFLTQIASAQLPNVVVGTASSVDNNYQTVMFEGEFVQVPLIFTLNGNANPTGSLLRIKDVTTTGFSIAQLEANNASGGATSPVDVSYFAIEPGTGTIGGLQYAAGTHTTNTVESKTISTGYDNVAYGDTINNPVVTTFIQSVNDPNVATLATAIESDSITATQFNVALERAEDVGGTPITSTVAETIGFFAVEAGTGTFTTSGGDMVAFDFLNTPDNISGVDDGGQANPFTTGFSDDPLVVGNLNRRDGADGGWLRLLALSATNLTLAVDEDEASDTERNHTPEAASILAFSGAFSTLAVVPEPASIAIWSLLGLVSCGLAYRKVRRKPT